jgi:hypothetical protein
MAKVVPEGTVTSGTTGAAGRGAALLAVGFGIVGIGTADALEGALAPRVMVARCPVLRGREADGGGAIGFGIGSPITGACCAVDTCRLLITVLTPSTVDASFAAARRSVSDPTMPESVTTPLFAFTAICLFGRLASELIRF